MWAYATNRVHGLGLTSGEFWSSTPRELDAHSRVFGRGPWMQLNAATLAALHNGPSTRKDGRHWTSDMFMPDYRTEQHSRFVPDDSWKRSKAQVMGVIGAMTPKSPEDRRLLDNAAMDFQARQSRAAAAKANGAGAAEIIRIMEGR